MDFVKENLKAVILFGILYIIAMIIILSLIWSSNKEALPDFVKYSKITDASIDKKVIKQYMDELILAYSTQDIEYLYNISDESFLKEKIGDKKKYEEYLIAEGMFTTNIKVQSVTKYLDKTNVVYVFNVLFKDKQKQINIIEEYGEKFHITYGEYYSLSNIKKTIVIDSVEFSINKAYRNINSLEIMLNISNKGQKEVLLQIEKGGNVQLVLEDNTILLLENAQVQEEDRILSPNNSIEKKLIFKIPLDKQTKVKNIRLFNIKIGEDIKDIPIEIAI